MSELPEVTQATASHSLVGRHPLGSLGGGIFTSNPSMTHRGAMAFFLRCSEVWRLWKAILAMRWEDSGCGQPLGVIARHGGHQPVKAARTQQEAGLRDGPGTEGHVGLSLRIPGFSLLVVLKATHSGFLALFPLGVCLDGSSKLVLSK